MGTCVSWICLWRLITPHHWLKSQSLLTDSPAFVAAAPDVATGPATATAPAKVDAKKESEGLDEHMVFGLFD